jgi:hypothetical protein
MCYISHLAEKMVTVEGKGLPALVGRKGMSTSTRRREA